MKKYLFVMIAVFMVMTLAMGCTANNPPASSTSPGTASSVSATPENTATQPVVKEITWARSYDSSSLDPAEASDDNSMNIVSYITEGLTRCVNNKVVPGVAQSWDISDDGLTYTFHLRQSVWSDGTPVTAQDFVYSFDRLIDPAEAHTQASSGYLFANAQEYAEGTAQLSDVGVKALDDNTLQIVFKNKGIENLYNLSMTQFRPVKKSLSDQAGKAYGSEKDAVIGNGPFIITEWSHEDRIVLEKNPNYWNADAINITKMTGIANIADDTAVEMMQTGQIDLADFTNPTYSTQLTDKDFSETSYFSSYQFLHINEKGSSAEAGKFLSNKNFRLALSYALDRTALCASVLVGQVPASRLVDPAMMGVNDTFQKEYPLDNGLNVTKDTTKAQQYLAQALTELGAKISDVPEFSMLCYESQTSQTALQACQDMFLNTLGITCKIDPQPIQQMIGKVYSFDYDFWYGGMPPGAMDVASYGGVLSYWDSSNPDALFGYNNPQYNDLFKTAQTTSDVKARKDAIFEMEKIFCSDISDLMLAWQTVYCVYKPDIVLNGIDINFGPDLAFADVIPQ